MTLKEKFLAINTYEEYETRREEFENMEFDEECSGHLTKIAKAGGWIVECPLVSGGYDYDE